MLSKLAEVFSPLGMWIADAFPLKTTIAIVAILSGFFLWGYHLYSPVKKAEKVVAEQVEQIRPREWLLKLSTPNNSNNNNNQSSTFGQQDTNRVMRI